MDGLQFTAEVIKALAWPVAVVIVSAMFRDKLKKLLESVRHAKGAGFEFDFSQEVRKVTEEAAQVQAIAEADQSTNQSNAGDIPMILPQIDEQRRLTELLRERPSALILDSWRDVEKAMMDVLAELGLHGAPGRRNALPPQWPGLLETQGVLTHEEAALARDLKALRNKVAHALDWEPTTADAFDYHRSAALLASVLRNKLAEIKHLKH